MWGPFLQSRAGVHSKDTAKALKVTLLTELLAGDTCRIISTKKCSGTASPAQIKFHCRSKSFQKKKLSHANRHISPVSPRAEEARMFVIIKSQQRKNFIDDGIAKNKTQTNKKPVLATRRNQTQALVQAAYCDKEGRESQPQGHQNERQRW